MNNYSAESMVDTDELRIERSRSSTGSESCRECGDSARIGDSRSAVDHQKSQWRQQSPPANHNLRFLRRQARAPCALSDLTQRREVAKIGRQNFASSRLCVILYLVAALPLQEMSCWERVAIDLTVLSVVNVTFAPACRLATEVCETPTTLRHENHLRLIAVASSARPNIATDRQ
jgi:hypothetical protein